jgi:ribosomal RNA-processing protein 12
MTSIFPCSCLLVIVFGLVTNNIEELEAVLALGGTDDAQPVTELLLLEELLGQVLEVTTAEVLVGHNLDSAIAEVGDGDGLAEVAGTAVNLDALLQESRKGRRVENAVLGRLGSIDDELRTVWSAALPGSSQHLARLLQFSHTFLVVPLPPFFAALALDFFYIILLAYCSYTEDSHSRRRRAAQRNTYNSGRHFECDKRSIENAKKWLSCVGEFDRCSLKSHSISKSHSAISRVMGAGEILAVTWKARDYSLSMDLHHPTCSFLWQRLVDTFDGFCLTDWFQVAHCIAWSREKSGLLFKIHKITS